MIILNLSNALPAKSQAEFCQPIYSINFELLTLINGRELILTNKELTFAGCALDLQRHLTGHDTSPLVRCIMLTPR